MDFESIKNRINEFKLKKNFNERVYLKILKDLNLSKIIHYNSLFLGFVGYNLIFYYIL